MILLLLWLIIIIITDVQIRNRASVQILKVSHLLKQSSSQKADMMHMPLKKDFVLFTVIFIIIITIQMIYRPMLHSWRIHSELEVSWRLYMCVCVLDNSVCGSFGRGKVHGYYLELQLQPSFLG